MCSIPIMTFLVTMTDRGWPFFFFLRVAFFCYYQSMFKVLKVSVIPSSEYNITNILYNALTGYMMYKGGYFSNLVKVKQWKYPRHLLMENQINLLQHSHAQIFENIKISRLIPKCQLTRARYLLISALVAIVTDLQCVLSERSRFRTIYKKQV